MSRKMSPARHQLGFLRTPLTAGEMQVLEFFDRLLPPPWEIYIQPHLNGLRPDFVLLHPQVGIAVFEVKDWDLNRMEYWTPPDDPLSLWARSPQGKDFRISAKDHPLHKVLQYKQELLYLYCPRLGSMVVEQLGVHAVVTAGVIMPAMTTAQAQRLFQPLLLHLNLLGRSAPYHPIAGSDALQRDALGTVFPWAQQQRSKYMTPDLAQDLRSWLIEPDFAFTQREPLELDSHQRELVQNPRGTRYRRLKGPAGSGKSLVLAARAAHLTAEGREVLVVTYNMTLWHYLRDLAVRYPVPGRRLSDATTWCHFHEWCKRVCFAAGMDDAYRVLWRDYFQSAPALDKATPLLVPPSPGDRSDLRLRKVLDKQLPTLAAEAIHKFGRQLPRYHAILVDEGQDFNLEWWNLLRQVLHEDGEMLLVADETQDLYDRAKYWTKERMTDAGFSGPWAKLELTYRVPPSVVPHLKRFVQAYLPADRANLPMSAQGELDLYPAKLHWLQVAPSQVVATCVEQVIKLPIFAEPDLLSFSDITLLVESHEIGKQCVERLHSKGINCAHVFDRRNKRAFFMGDARIKVSTIHSFKGWETRALVVQVGRADTPRALAAVYVALSRLKRHPQRSFLVVVCSAPELETYGRTWPHLRTATAQPGGFTKEDLPS